MLKQVEHLYHFTRKYDTILEIFKYGFKPSYAKEMMDKVDILVPMVSFSNILLREVGSSEVMFYGKYAIGVTRSWGIAQNINPVVYTYENGVLHNSMNSFLYSSIFIRVLDNYKEHFEKFSKSKAGKFSELIHLTNTPKHSMDILDYLSTKYDEELLLVISNYAKSIYDSNLEIVNLTKNYKVKDEAGREFIAYNDREWRKIYLDLGFLLEGSPEYAKWDKAPKPHYDEDKYLLKFDISDIKVIMVADESEISPLAEFLSNKYGKDKILGLLHSKALVIDIQKNLVDIGY